MTRPSGSWGPSIRAQPNGARNYAVVVVLLDRRLGLSELCGLTLDDVHLDGKHCFVKVMGKGQMERIVYLGRRVHEALLMYRTFARPHCAKDGAVYHLFLGKVGRLLTPGSVEQMAAIQEWVAPSDKLDIKPMQAAKA